MCKRFLNHPETPLNTPPPPPYPNGFLSLETMTHLIPRCSTLARRGLWIKSARDPDIRLTDHIRQQTGYPVDWNPTLFWTDPRTIDDHEQILNPDRNKNTSSPIPN